MNRRAARHRRTCAVRADKEIAASLERQLPEPDHVDQIGPVVDAGHEWIGGPSVSGGVPHVPEAGGESEKPPEPEGPSDFSLSKLAPEVLPVKPDDHGRSGAGSQSWQIRSYASKLGESPGVELAGAAIKRISWLGRPRPRTRDRYKGKGLKLRES